MLTKEECLEAISNLKTILVTRHYDKELTKKYIKVLEQLIEAYFDLLRKYEILEDENTALVFTRMADDLLSRK